ncbi:hypothetical protein BUY89_12655 [Staphylococcus equorum]|uniref:putative cyclic bacteriocin n=1 Tax=Staphylococcus equorum TaxID=246432 RepID=UPI000D1C9008|nr:putative cyclic bacteriocin [Staphylococcus equorum]PTE90568.1 hypothetical protein BUY89_12655 [Staphylococcus equorum]
MTVSNNRFSAILPYMAMIIGALLFLVISDISFTTLLAGKISWAGINGSVITSILNGIVNGGSIANSVIAVVGVAAGGPITAALTAVGRGVLIKLIKRRGVKSVSKW